MPTDREDLARRLALATPRDTTRGLAFNAMFDVIRDHGSDDLAQSCDPAETAGRTALLWYPVSDYLKIAWTSADWLEEDLGGWEAVFREFGRHMARMVLESPVGKTLALVAARNPRQLLQNASAGYWSMVSYGQRQVTFPAETHAVFTFRGDFMHPAYHAGILGGAVEAMGGADVATEWRQTGPLESAIEVAWR
jgi:uncharacterized protein (TIGR02265 family)